MTEADVELLVALRAETTVFALTDAWGKRDTASALAAVESLLERSGTRELPRLVAHARESRRARARVPVARGGGRHARGMPRRG